jgi:hypothetical protein
LLSLLEDNFLMRTLMGITAIGSAPPWRHCPNKIRAFGPQTRTYGVRRPSRIFSGFLTVAFLCGTVSINAQETDHAAAFKAPEIGHSDLAGLLATARNQLPNDLEAGSVQAYLDGIAAYIYGYSLLAIAMTERVSTNVASAGLQTGRAPINQLYKEAALQVGSAFKDVVLPSTTTLYATGFFNLEKEPLVLHLPVINSDRFFIVQLLDGWTNVSRKSPSSRLAGISPTPGDYALVGPGWSGDLPSGVSETIRFDTDTVWQIMRVYTTGTEDDQNFIADQIFGKITLTPLSAYGKPYTPPDNLPVNPSIDVVTQPIKQLGSMDACAFFGTMSAMMRTKSSPEDRCRHGANSGENRHHRYAQYGRQPTAHSVFVRQLDGNIRRPGRESGLAVGGRHRKADLGCHAAALPDTDELVVATERG